TAAAEVELIHEAIVEAQAAHERATAELTSRRNAVAELREQGQELAHQLATARARRDTVVRRLAELDQLDASLGTDVQREEARKRRPRRRAKRSPRPRRSASRLSKVARQLPKAAIQRKASWRPRALRSPPPNPSMRRWRGLWSMVAALPLRASRRSPDMSARLPRRWAKTRMPRSAAMVRDAGRAAMCFRAIRRCRRAPNASPTTRARHLSCGGG